MTESESVVSTGIRAIVTLCSTERVDHLRRQLQAVRRHGDPRVRTIVVWVGDDKPPADLRVDRLVRVPPATRGLRLAAARNAGANCAVRMGARIIIFLDADCVPGPDLVGCYVAAARMHPNAVLCGPVTYLEEGADVTDDAELVALTRPHPARPAPAKGVVVRATPDEYPLFWSLSFAMTAATWRDIRHFDQRFEGYGAEDTDFAFALRDESVPLMWVGGAHAYHQHHNTSSPPVQHLDDILRNGALFADKWLEWPMTGWLEAFEQSGAVVRADGGWKKASA